MIRRWLFALFLPFAACGSAPQHSDSCATGNDCPQAEDCWQHTCRPICISEAVCEEWQHGATCLQPQGVCQ